jgi:flagellar protein FliS
MTVSARALAAYQEVDVASRSPLELVVLVYDETLEALRAAHSAIERRDLTAKAAPVSRALGLLGQLLATLDMEQGAEVASRLDALYTYVVFRISDANVTVRTEPLDDAIRLLLPLRDAWAELARRETLQGAGARESR